MNNVLLVNSSTKEYSLEFYYDQRSDVIKMNNMIDQNVDNRVAVGDISQNHKCTVSRLINAR